MFWIGMKNVLFPDLSSNNDINIKGENRLVNAQITRLFENTFLIMNETLWLNFEGVSFIKF